MSIEQHNLTPLSEYFNCAYQMGSSFNINESLQNLNKNYISIEIKKIPLRIICIEAGLNENQSNLILQLNENISTEYIVDDWNSKLFKILAYIIRLNFNHHLSTPLSDISPHNHLDNFIENLLPKIQLPQQIVTCNNFVGYAMQQTKLTSNNEIKDCNENFAREAQNICRNKDLYLMLVNTAVYGNFNYKYYENQKNYYKAAEYFALSGFGDSLDSTYQFSEYDNKSSSLLSSKNDLNAELSSSNLKSKMFNSDFNQCIRNNLNNNSTSNGNAGLNQFQPAAFYGINIPYHSKILPVQNFLPKAALNFLTPQQVLMQSSQPTNFLSNYPTIFQPTQTMLLTNALPMSSPYFNSCFNETHINTSIIQQQQYNIGSNNAPYDMLFYAQMLQKSHQITQTIFAYNKWEQQQQQRLQLNSNLANLVQISDSINIAKQMNFHVTQNFLNLAKYNVNLPNSSVYSNLQADSTSSTSKTVSSNENNDQESKIY